MYTYRFFPRQVVSRSRLAVVSVPFQSPVAARTSTGLAVLLSHPQARNTAFCRFRSSCFLRVSSALSWRLRFASQATQKSPAVGGGVSGTPVAGELQGRSQSKHSPNTRRPCAALGGGSKNRRGGSGLLDFFPFPPSARPAPSRPGGASARGGCISHEIQGGPWFWRGAEEVF